MSVLVELEYEATFGSGDSSGPIPWDALLEGEAEKAYIKAKRFHLPFEDFSELDEVLENESSEIEEQELENYIDMEDDFVLECLGKIPMNPDEINELVYDRNEHVLSYLGIEDLSDEELEEWDANNLDELPNICDIDEDFEPSNPFEDGWFLEVRFVECPEDESIDEEEARQTISELLDESDGDYSELLEYIEVCSEIYLGDDLMKLATEIALSKGIELTE